MSQRASRSGPGAIREARKNDSVASPNVVICPAEAGVCADIGALAEAGACGGAGVEAGVCKAICGVAACGAAACEAAACEAAACGAATGAAPQPAFNPRTIASPKSAHRRRFIVFEHAPASHKREAHLIFGSNCSTARSACGRAPGGKVRPERAREGARGTSFTRANVQRH